MKSLKNNHIVTIIGQRFVALCDVPICKEKGMYVRHVYSVAQRQCPTNTKNRFIVFVSVYSFDVALNPALTSYLSPSNLYVYAFATLEDCSKYIMESVEIHLLRDYAQVSLWHDNAISKAILSNFEHNDKYKYYRNFILSHIY